MLKLFHQNVINKNQTNGIKFVLNRVVNVKKK